MSKRKSKDTAPEVAEPLKEEARAALLLSDEDRITYIRSLVWLPYKRANQIKKILESLLHYPRKPRMPNLLIVGPTNNGKTTIITQFYNEHPAQDNPEGDAAIIPVMVVQAPPVPDEGRFYDAILEKLNAPYKPTDKPSKKYFQILRLLENVGTLILIIDELHNILAGSTHKQHNFRNTIKNLGNDMQIPIVGAGTSEAYNAIQSDTQLSNRFRVAKLPKWKLGDKFDDSNDFLRLLTSFEQSLPLKKPSHLIMSVLATKLSSMSEGLLGELSTVLIETAVIAIKSGKECIDLNILEELDWTQPSDRQKEAYLLVT